MSSMSSTGWHFPKHLSCPKWRQSLNGFMTEIQGLISCVDAWCSTNTVQSLPFDKATLARSGYKSCSTPKAIIHLIGPCRYFQRYNYPQLHHSHHFIEFPNVVEKLPVSWTLGAGYSSVTWGAPKSDRWRNTPEWKQSHDRLENLNVQ